MRTFVAVVESGGFSSAGRRMGVSKALVSKHVGQLEEALGLRLLHRTTRRVNPTTSGQAYFERCKVLIEELEELESSLQSEQREPSGELRINAPSAFAELHLMQVVSDYSDRYPEVLMRLKLTDRFVDLVEEGVDLAIRVGELADSSLVARKLTTTRMLVCASPAYLARVGVPVTPAELTNHTCIIDTNYRHNDRWCIGGEHTGQQVFVAGPVHVNSARAARELLIAGRGIGFVPSFVVAEDVASGRLVQLFAELSTDEHGIYAVYTHRRHLSAKVRLFIDMLAERLQALA